MTSPNLVFLDSGAFSAWNSQVKISIDEYVRFCLDHPKISYYVNLDVIPGIPGQPRTRTPASIEESCKQGWKNYMALLKVLPEERVIPVFHRGEQIKWLEKYLDFGTPYIGIGQLVAFGGKEDQKEWLNSLRPYLFDSAGKPTVKTHGFAVTAFELMKHMQWHSVDSSSWVKQAAFGTVYIPQIIGGEYRYDVPPFLLNMSPKSPSREDRQAHIETLSPMVLDQVQKYLATLKMGLGKYEIVDVPTGHKRNTENELWGDKTKTSVMRIHEKGLQTCHQARFWANMKFIHKANDVISVDHIYFAGGVGSLLDQIEYRLKRRLMSYHTLMAGGKRCIACLDRWLEQADEPSTFVTV